MRFCAAFQHSHIYLIINIYILFNSGFNSLSRPVFQVYNINCCFDLASRGSAKLHIIPIT